MWNPAIIPSLLVISFSCKVISQADNKLFSTIRLRALDPVWIVFNYAALYTLRSNNIAPTIIKS